MTNTLSQEYQEYIQVRYSNKEQSRLKGLLFQEHKSLLSDLMDDASDIGRSLSFAELAPREQNTFCALIKWLIDMSNNKAALVEIDDMKALFTTKK